MLQAITKRLKRGKRGISTVIVVMLSLVLVVIIVGNVVLWNFQMNQFDIDRMQETLSVMNATRMDDAPWVTAQTDFTINAGTKVSGSWTDTTALDGEYESFMEALAGVYSYNPSSYVLGGSTTYVSGSTADLTSNDGNYMNFRSYSSLEVDYAESLEVSSTTSKNYQDKVTISFTPEVTADFVIIATAEVQGSNLNYQAKAQLTVNSAVCQELAYRLKDYSDWYPFDGLKRLTLNSGSNYEIQIQFCTSNAAAYAYIRNARIVILNLQSEYAESEELSTTGSTNWQDKTTLTFTPSSSGEYLVIATANYRGSHTNRDVDIRLIQDDTTVHTDNNGRPGSGTTENYYNFGVMRQVTLDASQHEFKIQYSSSGTPGEAGIVYAHIVALDLSQFADVHYVEDETESSPFYSNYWTDKVVNTYQAESGDYLILGSISYKSGSTSRSVGLDFQTEGISRQHTLVEHRSSNDYESVFFMTKQSLSAGSKTDSIMWMGENYNPRVKNARLISCKLPTSTQTVEVELVGTASFSNWTQVEWAADLSFTTSDVATTLQLYDYNTGQYSTSGDGYIADIIGEADATKSQQITTEAANFRDGDGNWKVKVTGSKTAAVPFELKIDWAEIEATTSDVYRLDISNDFSTGLSADSRVSISSLEIVIHYNVTENAEKCFLKAYNWATASFSDADFSTTSGSQPALDERNEYAITVTGNCADYISDTGMVRIKFFDEGLPANQTVVDVDFLGVRTIAGGTQLEIKNSSPLTVHVVAVWITDATTHQRYAVNWFLNAGETANCTVGAALPQGAFVAKVVTERGNVAVFSSG
jgi:hypothetical protein